MEKNILFVGLDVDDKSFHCCGTMPSSGFEKEFKSSPTTHGVIKKLLDWKREFGADEVKVCYEASYIGFTLQRALTDHGFHCDVVAPSSIPRTYGNAVKTDRIDSRKLARFYAKGLVSFVTVPSREQEDVRDLMRTRQYVMNQVTEIRCHIQAMLRRQGISYKEERGGGVHWTKHHLCWLDRVVENGVGSFGKNLKLLVRQMKYLSDTLSEYNILVDELAARSEYERKVKALTASFLAEEIRRDIRRFWRNTK